MECTYVAFLVFNIVSISIPVYDITKVVTFWQSSDVFICIWDIVDIDETYNAVVAHDILPDVVLTVPV